MFLLIISVKVVYIDVKELYVHLKKKDCKYTSTVYINRQIGCAVSISLMKNTIQTETSPVVPYLQLEGTSVKMRRRKSPSKPGSKVVGMMT